MTKICFILLVNIAPAKYISEATFDKPCEVDFYQPWIVHEQEFQLVEN